MMWKELGQLTDFKDNQDIVIIDSGRKMVFNNFKNELMKKNVIEHPAAQVKVEEGKVYLSLQRQPPVHVID